MKKILLPILFAAFACTSYAQTTLPTQPAKRCSSHEYYLQMLRDDPQFAQNQAKIEAFTQNFIKSGGAQSMGISGRTAAAVYTIPVVVHVVYNTSAQNISDAQIQSQIDVLNKDYQKLNSDVTKVPSVWTSLVADCQVQFCLATIDVNGNATTGIIRKNTTKTSFSTNNYVKHNNNGGDDAWDAKKYLNLWVCHLGGGILGYAQFPGGNVANDGVVIDYKAFGTNGSAAYPYNLGRTATHEVGHWLNLKHIWGDDGSACYGSDLVGDTPNQADEHYGCPKFPQISCNNNPNGEMYMNYMDYTDDRCMYMFTIGQRDRMTATLVPGGSRNSVTVSGKCGTLRISRTATAPLNTNLAVLPNPVITGTPTLSYNLHASAKVQASVFSIYGTEINTINFGNQSSGNYSLQPMELNNLENGIYIIKLIANGKTIGNTRFIVSK